MLSSIYLDRAEAEDDEPSFDQSALWAARTVELAPIQPYAWTRLAWLAEVDHVTEVCDVELCLDRSWRAAPMMDEWTACTRLHIADRAAPLGAEDPRIELYLRSGVSPANAERCLTFLTPEERSRLMQAPGG